MARILAALLVVVAGACVNGHVPLPAPGAAAARLPVLLVAEGTAIDGTAARDIGAALSARIGRPVVTATEPALDGGALRARLVQTYGRLPAGGWDEPRCAAGRAAAHALSYDTDAYYHLRLDRTDTTRQATPEERAAVSAAHRASATILGGLGLAAAGQVREARLDGELTVTTFGPTAGSRRLPVKATARETDAIGTVRLDPRTAVEAAIGGLEPPPYPHWDATARRDLAAGCRVAALAVYDARLRTRAGSRDMLARTLGKGPARAARPRETPAAPAAPPTPSVVEAPAPDPRSTCHSLCEVHMVELCNNDRDLWSRHQLLWESTPCGQRRSEPFLRECYQRQWLSGTFDDACRIPCERAPDGRARLLHLLQGAGCGRTTTL